MKRTREADHAEDPCLPFELLGCEIIPRCDPLTRRLILLVSKACRDVAQPLVDPACGAATRDLLAHGSFEQFRRYAALVEDNHDEESTAVLCAAIESGNLAAVQYYHGRIPQVYWDYWECAFCESATLEMMNWLYDENKRLRAAYDRNPLATVSKIILLHKKPPSGFILRLLEAHPLKVAKTPTDIIIACLETGTRNLDESDPSSVVKINEILLGALGTLTTYEAQDMCRNSICLRAPLLLQRSSLLDRVDIDLVDLFERSVAECRYECALWFFNHSRFPRETYTVKEAIQAYPATEKLDVRLVIWLFRQGVPWSDTWFLEYCFVRSQQEMVFDLLDAGVPVNVTGFRLLRWRAVYSIRVAQYLLANGVEITEQVILDSLYYMDAAFLDWVRATCPEAWKGIRALHLEYVGISRRFSAASWFLAHIANAASDKAFIAALRLTPWNASVLADNHVRTLLCSNPRLFRWALDCAYSGGDYRAFETLLTLQEAPRDYTIRPISKAGPFARQHMMRSIQQHCVNIITKDDDEY